MIGLGDNIPVRHDAGCIERDYVLSSGYRVARRLDSRGLHRAIPFPFRIGKNKSFKKGDKDICLKEQFNGIWWYKIKEDSK